MYKWISVKDQLPEKYKDVLIYTKGELTHVCYLDYLKSGEKVFKDLNMELGIDIVLYWMKLPKSPIMEEC